MYRFIAHRGNVCGPDPDDENKPAKVEAAILGGYEVEIDLWMINNKLYLGHDEPAYEVNDKWLLRHEANLWIHCKNHEALTHIITNHSTANYFWHNVDNYSLTSNGFIWVYPGVEMPNKCGIAVMPEKAKAWDVSRAVGFCSDYIGDIKRNATISLYNSQGS